MPDRLLIRGARVHNLKNVSLALPKNKLIVFTGLSGSGKSSLAFDTIYAEGQRRYVESLSAYARQFLNQMDKPDVERIEGLSPAISIDQKSPSHNPRSTVGTITEIYDYLRLLFANVGHPHCPTCGDPIQSQSVQEIQEQILGWPKGTAILIMSPLISGKKGTHKSVLDGAREDGFSRVRVDGEIFRLSEPISLEKNKKHTIELIIDRLTVEPDQKTRLFESVETGLRAGNGVVEIEQSETGKRILFSQSLACPKGHVSLAELSPRLFSFNSPYGACLECNGLGIHYDFDPDLILADSKSSVIEATQKCINFDGTILGRLAQEALSKTGCSLQTRVQDLTKTQVEVLLYGDGKPVSGFRTRNWEGIIPHLRRRSRQTRSEAMRFFFRRFMRPNVCSACEGARINAVARAVSVGKKSIGELTDLSIESLAKFFKKLRLTATETKIADQILKEINERLAFLQNVGLDYLTLGRSAGTLSGGEYQRIRLATQIGSGLTGVLYVLDEPSIGLHQRDNDRLIQTLCRLRDLGNTLIVVEHDEDTIRVADHIVDIGPGAGRKGGEIVYSGSVSGLRRNKKSLTAKYLAGTAVIEVPKKRRKAKSDQAIHLVGACENNLKNIDVSFPLGQLVCITGVSGSGKSTLINDTLQKALARYFNKSRVSVGAYQRLEGLDHIDKMITIDQSPIGRTPRSNPATYTGLFSPIRELFTQTRGARVRGYKPGRFSFNVKGGRCEACEGDGVVKIEMHFLSDVYVRCEVCKGKRYNNETLQVLFKGRSIADVLAFTVNEALEHFENIPTIKGKLQTLADVGLGYVQLGQNATTLSGGEAQRIKLAKELSKRSTGQTLYLLDEPTTGLHFDDVNRLLGVLNRLVDAGNTVIVIEHNLDVIKMADHIIDLGPEGGDKGGKVVATGTPEQLARHATSYTGQYLS